MANLVCSPNAATAFDYLVNNGLRDFQAAAVVGNLQWESGIDPTKAVVDTNGKMSRGIAMWQPPRWQNLLTFAGTRDPLALVTQLEFLWSELPSYGLSQLVAASQLSDAVVSFQNLFEKPNAALAHTDKRIALAQAVLYACPVVRAPAPIPKSKVASAAGAAGIVTIMAAVGYGVYRALKSFAPKPAPRFPAPSPSPQRFYPTPPVYRPVPPRPPWNP